MAEQRPSGHPTETRYGFYVADDNEDNHRGTPIPKRRPPGHVNVRRDGAYTEGSINWR